MVWVGVGSGILFCPITFGSEKDPRSDPYIPTLTIGQIRDPVNPS